jgi:hypothetical protein
MAGSACSNCGKKLSCGCQRRQANNGTSGCSSCVAALNAELTKERSVEKLTVVEAQKLNQATPKWGMNRYKKY